jgi:hypothetical protein
MTDTIGAQLPQPDPRGWLTFESLPDDLQRAEDSTAAADFDHRRFGRVIQRPATAAERTLLEHLGYEVPTPLTTHVRYLTESVRNRRWPALEEGNQPS